MEKSVNFSLVRYPMFLRINYVYDTKTTKRFGLRGCSKPVAPIYLVLVALHRCFRFACEHVENVLKLNFVLQRKDNTNFPNHKPIFGQYSHLPDDRL